MVIRKGYKQTELGIIPEDWDTKPLSECGKITMGQSPESKYYNKSGDGLPLIQGNADIENRKTITRVFTSEFPKIGKVSDIIMTVRAPVGNIAKATFDCCLGRGVCSISYKNDYLYHYLIFIENSWKSMSSGSTFDSINYDGLSKIKIKIPKSTKEQELIANNVSEIDKLIDSLESLIQKKKNIKQGAMQELLTGKRRLEGFSGEWKFDTIKNLGKITTGSRNTQDKIDDGQYPFFVRSKKIERINSFSYDGEAVLTAGDGVGTGKVFHYIVGKFDFHQRVYKISDFNENLDGYFFYIYFRNYFLTRIMSMTAKSSVDSVRMEMISEMTIPLPDKNEQKAISKILSDMDSEIEQLESLKEKYTNLKQAMMQKLLTGEIRLV